MEKIMGKRSYDQYCALARSLDVIGGRWTLLIIRELLTGPKRFKNLMDNLPGIGTNLLSNRLKHLENSGLIRKITLPPPAEVSAYDLTERGVQLEAVILELVRWGDPYLQRGPGDDYVRAGWAILGLKSLFDPQRAGDTKLTCQFEVDDEHFWAHIDRGNLQTQEGVVENPELEIHTDQHTFALLGNGEMDLEKGIAEDKIKVVGNEDDLYEFFSSFRF